MDPELLRLLMLSQNTGGYVDPGMLGGPVPPTAPSLVPTGLTTPANAQPAPLLTTPAPVRPVEPYMTDPLATPPAVPPIARPASLGASLEPMVPMPRPRPAEAPGGSNPSRGSTADAAAIGNTLKSVVSPQAPQGQKVSTPHAAPMAKIAGSNLADLLAGLGIGPQQAFPGLKLPSTLGQALGGR